jgi:hypothetical protein
MDQNRRKFASHFLPDLIGKSFARFSEGMREARIKADFEAFFTDYESSYSLTLAYPDEILIESAKKEGIEVEGREKIDIVKELWMKKGGDYYR